MSVAFRRYTDQEDRTLLRMFEAGDGDLAIAAELGRTRDSIIGRRMVLNLWRKRDAAPGMIRAEKVHGDTKFIRAMLAARSSGSENVVLGVVKDRRPTIFAKFAPEGSPGICSSMDYRGAE